MKKKVNEILRKCKSLSTKLGRSSSYGSLRSKSERLEEDVYSGVKEEDLVEKETIFVGSLRRRYLIKAKLLDHPLVSALIERSKESIQTGHAGGDGDSICVKCEIVIFDHLLWMLENDVLDITTDSLEELAELYAY